jgi:intracellular septation protein
MKLLFDIFPILIFFVCYKIYGIYSATAVAMIASFLQVVLFRIRAQRFEKMHLISFGLIVILGSATLFFHNPAFIKLKPTGIYWLSACAFLGSFFIGKKTLIQKMIDGNINLPPQIWKRLNFSWALFFVIMGLINLYVAKYFTTDMWVNFKLFGGAGLTLLFVFLQAIYLTKHAIDKDESSTNSSTKVLNKS